MTTQTIYCSACDREVVVRLEKSDDLEGSVCMDLGEACTGAMCPICAQPPEQMRAKLIEIHRQDAKNAK